VGKWRYFYSHNHGLAPTICGWVQDPANDVYNNLPYTNIADKGFRVTAGCFKFGGQILLQPPFMKSDISFTSQQTFETAAIAAIWSANERAMNQIIKNLKGLGATKKFAVMLLLLKDWL
jgi:hypothetical protein